MSSSDDVASVRLSQSDDDQLTIQTGPSSTTHMNMVRDDQLSWRDFDLGKTYFLTEIIRTGWPKAHVDSLSAFFFLISSHAIRGQPGSDAAAKVYADRTHYEWHNTLGTEHSFNIALINEDLLRKTETSPSIDVGNKL
ncbi:hypothetical protein DFH09DRAFT_1330169 [Mycena vulgaris]|nr:hypothetical protein DFH09DRAFT_1330169 [Mycena vulgaris]